MKGPRPDVKALANASRELLNQGDVVGAEQVLSPVFDELWADPSVWHLMGLIKQAQQKMQEAERLLRRAVAEDLTQGAYYNDLGVVLQARGEFPEALKIFRAAVALMPTAPACRVNLIHCLMQAGDYPEAEREARAYIAALPSPESWTLLSLVQRNEGRFEDALGSAEAALKLAPKQRGLKHNRGIALDRLGRTKEALDVFEQLAREDLETPELALNFARALYQEKRAEDTEKILEQCAKHWPGATGAHLMLARLRLMRGMGSESAALIEAAIAERPKDLGLRLICADFLNRNGFGDRARLVLEEALRVSPDAPGFLSALGITLDGMGRSAEALELLLRAATLAGNTIPTQRNLIAPLLRTGRASEALPLIRTLRRGALRDQFLLAAESTALRLMGDPGYSVLCDYERQVRLYDLAAPKGFFTIENYNAALAESLRVQLQASNSLDQTIPNGVQTGRDLRQVSEGNIQDFFAAIDAPIRRYLSGLDAEDPVGRRRANGYRLRAPTGTLLGPGGYIPNHVHDSGWISAVYFVEAPPAEGHAGWMKFGEPPWKITGCDVERWIEPKPGVLVMAASYFWHGVEKIDTGERLSIAFDVTPA